MCILPLPLATATASEQACQGRSQHMDALLICQRRWWGATMFVVCLHGWGAPLWVPL